MTPNEHSAAIEPLTKEERSRCKAHLHSLLSWVGVQMPDEVELGSGIMNVRDFVFSLLTKNELTDEDIEISHNLLNELEKLRQLHESELESSELSKSEAEQLCAETTELIRAITALKGLDTGKHTSKMPER
ncbi:MAG: hypothetical protein KAH86_08470, partial [Methanosarcinales archaeon]|nr:hypothetical protein [Methanosarcinales archaeon]